MTTKASIFFLLIFPSLLKSQEYFPDAGNANWERRAPIELNVDSDLLDSAIQFAQNNVTTNHPNLEINHYQNFGTEPFGDGIGEHKTRGKQSGIIIKNGYIIAEWGEPNRVDMTFSVSKSFLSSTVGVAYDHGLIKNIHDKVDPYMSPIFLKDGSFGDNKAHRIGEPMVLEPFKSEHNQKITWDHLLRQTSDWEGTLWGKPDWADRPKKEDKKTWMTRERHEPGSVYKYNDTRVNVLALAATNLWNRPLQQVLKEYIMNPIGASNSWRWMGYHNSWIVLNGEAVQVPSGGGHWGGGMFINAYDQGRFGYLTLHRGRWNDNQILSEDWVKMALTPTLAKDDYGFMNWFLNTDKKRLPSAPQSAYFHLGAGVNMVYVDPENDIVVVARWIDGGAMDGLIKRVIAAIN